MGSNNKTRTLSVWMNGEAVGRWTHYANRRQEFAYDDAWLLSPSARPISLSLPLRPTSQPYRDQIVADYFDNLLPESQRIRQRLQQRFKTASSDVFDLLAEVGRDCVGALQLLPDGQAPQDVHRIEGEPLSSAHIERLLSHMQGAPLGQQQDEDDFRISIAGVQEKTALLRQGRRWMRPLGATPTTHIFKLPISAAGTAPRNIDMSTSVENEWLCAQILKAYGVPVADCEIHRFGSQKVLGVTRFDRRLSTDGSWWLRLPQEDFCQATATPAAFKYESDGGPGIVSMMRLLLGSAQAEADRRDFLRTQILYWLLCAIDGHAKNYSIFIEAGGRYRLTPRYDVLSAYPVLGDGAGQLAPQRAKMALALEGKNRHYQWHTMQRRHWVETARRCGMASEIDGLIEGLVAQTPMVIERVRRLVPSEFDKKVAERILLGLERAAQRLGRELQ